MNGLFSNPNSENGTSVDISGINWQLNDSSVIGRRCVNHCNKDNNWNLDPYYAFKCEAVNIDGSVESIHSVEVKVGQKLHVTRDGFRSLRKNTIIRFAETTQEMVMYKFLANSTCIVQNYHESLRKNGKT